MYEPNFHLPIFLLISGHLYAHIWAAVSTKVHDLSLMPGIFVFGLEIISDL